ncbi:MAG: cupin domain-containing protein [Gammaproteobacteria bacterium]|nr:cupin domain-containing protein [Gammaproteobacteria bacterium]
MSQITIETQADRDRLRQLGVFDWPVWTKEVSEFPWAYDATETCYFLEGSVIVTPEGGEPVSMGKGDLVSFPAGMRCRWQILEDVSKHYTFS